MLTAWSSCVLQSLLLLLALEVACVQVRQLTITTATSVIGQSTTVDPYLDYSCPPECICYSTNETQPVPSVLVNCSLDIFSPHVTRLVLRLSSPLTGVVFFTCSSREESSLWDGALALLPQLRALAFYGCQFQKLPKDAFRGLASLTQLVIHGAIISDLDPGLLTYLPRLDVLEISYSSLTHLFPLCASNSLRVLNVSGNHLQSWQHTGLPCPAGTTSGLVTLDLNRNFLTELPDWLGESLPNLYYLGVADNRISVAGQSPFRDLPKLTFLDVSNNSLGHVGAKFFNGCSNLHLLGVSGNPMSSLGRGLLANLSVLQQLELAEMGLGDGAWLELTELRHLAHLNMSFNQLHLIHTDVMSQFLRLEFCYLHNNRISALPRTVFEYQRKLHTLDLSFNNIPDISSGVFKNQQMLKHLHLHHNQIAAIGYEALNQLKELVTFDVSHNRISSLPSRCFQNMSHVARLDISSNNLTWLDSDSFLGLTELTYLNLSNNLLTDVSLTNQLPQLLTVDISHNRISALTSLFTAGLRSLVTFSASHNELKLLPLRLFKGCDNLTDIDLSHNALQQLDEATFSNTASVEVINLSHNHISDLATVFSGLKDLQTLDLSYNRLTKVLRGQLPHPVQHLNLAYNKIEFISAHTFKSLSRIRTVDLRNNLLTSINRMDVEIPFHMNYIPVFQIQYNPFVCDCKMGWLKDWSMGKLKDMLTIPKFVLNSILSCTSPFYQTLQSLQRLPRSEFLCPYRSHCEESCMCCDYACYCKYVCPQDCQCYIGDDNWHVHQVKCRSANLTQVPPGLPEGATDLHLDGNNIPVLRKHEFLVMKRVDTLYLNNSQIEVIESNAFKGLKSVKRLFLNDNKLTSVGPDALLGLESLEELFLNNNYIHTLDFQAFLALSTLTSINFQNNMLTSLPFPDMMTFTNRSLDNNLKPKLYLSGNHWHCDIDFACKFLSFVQKNSEFIADINTIECVPSEQTFLSHIRSSLLIDLHSELCMLNVTGANMTRPSIEALTSTNEIYALVAICIIVVFAIALLVAAYVNRQFLQVLCFSKFGFRVFKMAGLSEDSQRPYDAFISYSNKDEDFVIGQLAPRLENGDKRFKLCVHYRDFPVGACIAETIVRSVEASKRTILVVSDNFLDSEWCRFEFQTAHQQVLNERRNRVVLILLHELDSDKLDNTLKAYMKTRTYLKYDDPWFWEKLMFALPDVCQKQPPPLLARNGYLTGGSHFPPGPNYQATTDMAGFPGTTHNGMYEVPIMDVLGGHYQLANSVSCSTPRTNSALSEGSSGYHNGSLGCHNSSLGCHNSSLGYHNSSLSCQHHNGSCHYEEVGPASVHGTPQKQLETPPPVPSFPKEGFLPKQRLMTLQV